MQSINIKTNTSLEKALPNGLTVLFAQKKRYVFVSDIDAFVIKFKELTGHDLVVEMAPSTLYFYRFSIVPNDNMIDLT